MQTIEQAWSLLQANQPLVMATIVSSSGSVPRSPGAKMLVKTDGTIMGTIGGGLLEANIIKLAQDVFLKKDSRVAAFSLNDIDANSIGMICGGEVEVLLNYVDPQDSICKSIYNELANLRQDEPKWLVTVLPTHVSDDNRPRLFLLRANGTTEGGYEDFAQDLLASVSTSRANEIIVLKNHRLIIELFTKPNQVFIFGAGHVGQKVAELLPMLGFTVIILDDRTEYAYPERFPLADEIVILNSFDNLLERVDINRFSYIVIVTRGHLHDREVLAQALKTPATYIGMIGSRRKRDEIYQVLLQEGFTEKDLQRVKCPIGLDIGAETPEEIAVSIAAELVKIRTGK